MSAFRAALASLRALPLAAFWRMIGVMLRAAPRESALVFGVNLLTGRPRHCCCGLANW